MAPMQRFSAPLQPAPHGGHYVVVPPAVVAAAGIKHHSRVRGTCNGVPYRSSTPVYSGIHYLGLHKAMLAEAGAVPGEQVELTIELDTEPLPTDAMPDDLKAALARDAEAAAAWEALRPSHKREHVKSILEAKKAETRATRVDKTVAMLRGARKD
jgi:hypothetical protein